MENNTKNNFHIVYRGDQLYIKIGDTDEYIRVSDIIFPGKILMISYSNGGMCQKWMYYIKDINDNADNKCAMVAFDSILVTYTPSQQSVEYANDKVMNLFEFVEKYINNEHYDNIPEEIWFDAVHETVYNIDNIFNNLENLTN